MTPRAADPVAATAPTVAPRPLTREELVLVVVTVVGLGFAAWLLLGLLRA